jgi:hypothetical protein
MKTTYALPIAAALSFALLGACSKPAATSVDEATTATADAAATTVVAADNSATGVAAPGGAVSPPQANGAVNTDANATAADVAPASNSFTEGQAKGHIENAGYSNVTGLTKTSDGLWTAKATKGGKTLDVTVDFKGAVTTR